MNHDDPDELLRQLVVVTKTVEEPSNPCLGPSDHQMKDQLAQDKHQNTFEPQNIKSQGSKMKKEWKP